MPSIIFLGTPNFGSVVLEGLVQAGYDIKAVVTQPDKKVGRKQVLHESEVKQTAKAHNLPIYQPAKLSGSPELEELIALKPDFIVTAAYGQFLPTKFLNSAKIAPVNVHGSLLPKYRGGAPIQYSIINGDAETGVTIMEMVKKMDAGVMYAQESLPIEDEDTSGTMFAKLSILGRDLLLETLPKFLDGTLEQTPQDESKVVFSPNISKEQEQIKTTLTAQQANNLIRGLNPDPGAYLILDGKRMKVWKAKVSEETTDLPAGSLVSNKKRFALAFANGSVLDLLEVQPTGKKKMGIKDFVNGQGSHYEIGAKIIED
ncbi:methionyl-tRNA formyltransferase [Lactobacillus sp. PV037]|uniref:methionyl-tRNA formyltransferase n=1 Tax=Lactobacillus sp. PV037 TaxID=2594496 RepID=UPI00223EDEFF|nr:methionyl-tRNA formyltransferase [Lactobacillus sp. PV037]QNQ83878.1 methionyl-tRNA formyltransferase [Lactobacillus sp. PV037]